ncbi:MAG: MerR family transcriptional regulator [Phascolarctobacterium sp.]|nr:MerR family transcriptional regulator [Phascolarctobacterium sp.]
MKKDSEKYFTAGELASLFNIPKQTLLYYDKMKLIEPEFISENGYRHYSMRQYLTLEVIINLRKIDVPITKIQEYINKRNLEEFQEMLLNKKSDCERIIEENVKTQASIDRVLDNLKELQNGIQYIVTLSHQPETRYFCTSLKNIEDGKKRIEMMATHNKIAFTNSPFKEVNLSWVIPRDTFFKEHYDHACSYISEISPNSELEPYIIKPAGLYLSVRIYSTIHSQIDAVAKRLENFAQLNNLKIIGDVFIFPLKTYWVSNDYHEYINKISVQVELNQD